MANESRNATNNSRDASTRDAGRNRDARADDEEIPDEELPSEGDDEPVDEPVQPPPEEEPDAGPVRDAGRLDAGRDAGQPVTPDAGSPPAMGCGDKFADGLKLREIAAYQTVKVPLYRGGAWVTTGTAPLVAGKKTLVRVFVDTLSGYSRHAVRATLTLKGAQGESTLQSERTIAANSTDADEASTFSFEIEPAKLGTDTQLSVALEEPDCSGSGTAANARLPATGTQALGADAIGKLKVVLLPISIGSLLPTVDDAEITKIRNALLAYFPVGTVEVSVRASAAAGPTSLSGADSSGWSNVLNTVMRERAADRVGSDVYYFGLVKPAATFATFCARGCILGIAPQTTRVSASAQAGLGAYFQDAQSIETIVHELGHAHGRGHAPCAKGGSIQGVDGNFPDSSGGIMEWGWDSRSNKLISPSNYKDVMGYCSPNWISPYTYSALATRSLAVNTLTYTKAAPNATPWRNVLLYADGGARWGGAVETNMPGGELESATVIAASGATIATIEVTRMVLSHSDDTILYLPSPGADWASVVLRDRTLSLAAIQPAL